MHPRILGESQNPAGAPITPVEGRGEKRKQPGAKVQGYGSKARRLRELAQKLLSIASELELHNEPQEAGAPELSSLLVTSAQEHASSLDIALRQYNARRLREAVFEDRALFGEPAWNVLLDLFIAERQGKRMSVKSACIGAAAPLTTAFRWLRILEAKGYVQREHDGTDARRSYISLTPMGLERMTGYVTRLKLMNLARPGVAEVRAVLQD
jgi:hypothetical protein